MNTKKALLAACCCLVILGGTNYLLREFNSPIANAMTKQDVSGAAQFVGKHDIKESPYFKHPDFYNMQSNEHLTLLPKFATTQQVTYYTCGPAAANMVVKYYNGDIIDNELAVGKIMSTSSTVGTNTKGMVKYFEKLGWEVHSSVKDKTPDNYVDFLKFVESNLKNNTPIIVENVDWGGHWRVIIGYDTMGTEHKSDDVLIVADPFDTTDHLQDGYGIVPAERFFYMWFDHQLYSRSEQQRQWLTAKPK